MRSFFQITVALAVLSLPTDAVAQDKYSKFVGEWVASVQVARSCSGMTAANQESAARIARAQEGLRRQKVLRLLYYSKTALLEQQGSAALAARNLDLSNTQRLCGFGKSVAGKDDSIGRFLRVN